MVTASRNRVVTLKGMTAIESPSPAGCLTTPLGEPLAGVSNGGREIGEVGDSLDFCISFGRDSYVCGQELLG